MLRFRGVGTDVTAFKIFDEQMKQHAKESEVTRGVLEMQAADMAGLAEEAEGLRRKAEEANRAKSEFLATMSHEIRTPMTGVLGMAELALCHPLGPDLREIITTIKESGETLMTLLNDILDLSKIEAGKLEIEEADFLLAEVMENVISIFRERAAAKKNAIAVHIDPKAPKVLCGDGHRLRQILFNMTGNAVKFTENGGISVKVAAEESKDDQVKLRFAVEDTGIGISKDVQGKLFEKFTQAEKSTTRKYGGSGLGLAICNNLVELMGGEIGVDSEPGRGSAFWFTVWCRLGSTPASALERGEEAPALAPTEPLSILLAEDNKVNQKVVTALLAPLGQVAIAENGAEAVKAVQEGAFDVILMDIRMPEMDGPTATRKIREMGGDMAEIPIIALSADVMPENVEKYMRSGMNDYAGKPVDRKQLFEKIGRWVGSELHAEEEEKPKPARNDDAPEENEALDDLLKQMEAFADEA